MAAQQTVLAAGCDGQDAGQVLSPRQLLEQVWGWEYMQGGVQRASLF